MAKPTATKPATTPTATTPQPAPPAPPIPTPTPTFAQAQARLAARRQEREAASRAQAAATQSASQLRTRLASSSSPLVRSVGGSALAFWDAASSREGTRPAFRVGQVDAELLDEELLSLLRGQVAEALRLFGGRLADDWGPEVLLALRAVLFKLTVWDHNATYGAALQNLRYTDARRDGPVLVPPSRVQKGLYGAVTVGGRYLWTKWEDWLASRGGDDDLGHGHNEGPLSPRARRIARRLTSLASNVHAAAALVSFLAFLLHGRYRTLLDRTLRMRLAPPTSQVSRQVSFEYLNRQLVWHAFTEFLLFFLPLVGVSRWRRWIARAWKKTKEMVTTSAGEGQDDEKKGELAFLPERTCAICYQDQNTAPGGGSTEGEMLAAAASSSGIVGSVQTDITNPYETIPCGCIYCFVCLATRLEREEGQGWTCLRCGQIVRECKPWSGDVLEPPAPRSPTKSPTVKAVAFADDVAVTNPPPDRSGSPSPDLVDVTPEASAGFTSESQSFAIPTPAGGSSSDDNSEAYEEEEEEIGADMEES